MKKKQRRLLKEYRNPLRSKLDDVYLTQEDPEWHDFYGIEGRLIESDSEGGESDDSVSLSEAEDQLARPTHEEQLNYIISNKLINRQTNKQTRLYTGQKRHAVSLTKKNLIAGMRKSSVEIGTIARLSTIKKDGTLLARGQGGSLTNFENRQFIRIAE